MTHRNAHTGSWQRMLGLAAVVLVAAASPAGGLVEGTGTAHAAASAKVTQQQGISGTRGGALCRSRLTLC